MKAVKSMESKNNLDEVSLMKLKREKIKELNSLIHYFNCTYSSAEYLLREPNLKQKSKIKYLDYSTALELVSTTIPYLKQASKHLEIEIKTNFTKIDKDFDVFHKNKIEDSFSENINKISEIIESVLGITVYSFKSKNKLLQNLLDSATIYMKYYIINDFKLIANDLNSDSSRMRINEYKDKKYSLYGNYYINKEHGLFTYIYTLTKNLIVLIIFHNLKFK